MTQPTPQSLALIVGINKYPNCPGEDLHGCINDALAWQRMLTDQFGFPSDTGHTLLLTNPGRQAILDAFETHLIAQAGPGDLIAFVFSGHGAYTWDLEGDEPDGYDETLVPSDGHIDPTIDPRHITDDELFLFNARLKEKIGQDGFVVFIMDCCHSGSITRGVGRARFLNPKLPPRETLSPPPAVSPHLSRLERIDYRTWLPNDHSFVLLAACHDDERAFETDSLAGDTHGAFSLFLIQELMSSIRESQGQPWRLTYRDLLERAAPGVRWAGTNQTPQIAGDRDRLVFGGQRLTPEPYLPVEEVHSDGVTIGGGMAHMVTNESRFAIYAPGTRSLHEAKATGIPRLADVIVKHVGAISARATYNAPPEQVVDIGCRAFEVLHTYNDMCFPIAVVGAAPYTDNARLALGGSSLLRLVDLGDAPRLVIWALRPGETPRAETGMTPPQGLYDHPSFVIVDLDGAPTMQPTPADGDQDATTLRENVERIAKNLNLLVLKNRNPDAILRGKIRLALKRLEQRGSRYEPVNPPFDGQPVLTEGDLVALEITSTHDQPVYFSMFDLGLSWRISSLYPLAGQESAKLAPEQQSYTIGLNNGRPEYFPLSIPSVFPAERASGRETYKVLLTTQRANFSWLTQPGVSVPSTRADDPLANLLTLTRTGRVPDGMVFRGDDFETPESKNWLTEQVTFVLKRR